MFLCAREVEKDLFWETALEMGLKVVLAFVGRYWEKGFGVSIRRKQVRTELIVPVPDNF